MCLTLFSSCCRGGYMLYLGSYCGSLKDEWRTTSSSGSDNRACLCSKVYGLSSKEKRVDYCEFWVCVSIVEFSWDFIGGFRVGVVD